MTEPAALGAFVLIVNAAAPFAAPAAKAADKVTEQVNVAPTALGSAPQSTFVTLVPTATLSATTPGGSASFTVSVVTLAV